jgi:hypothetical protein
MAESKGKPSYDENLIRHIILNVIHSIKQKHSAKYGEIILCYDGKGSWRKRIFQYYKANRKKNREDSDFDWKQLFDFLTKVRLELTESLPYKVLYHEDCEADDIIASLSMAYGKEVPILIVSSDTDFIQLQTLPKVEQYSPIMKKFLKESNPEKYLFEHILRGDSSDGIPNYLSDDDILVTEGKRQRPVSAKKVDMQWSAITAGQSMTFESNKEEVNFNRNKTLIDLSCIPDTYREEILNMYRNAPDRDNSKIMDYFMKNGMKHMMSLITEF